MLPDQPINPAINPPSTYSNAPQPTSVISPADDEIRDFTHAVKVIRFRIAPDVFECKSGLPVMQLIRFAELSEQLDDAPISEFPKIFESLFGMIFTEASYLRFFARLDEGDHPIDFEHLSDLIPWLMEQYSLGRPTQPSSDSSDGSESPDGGTSSMVISPTVV